MGSVSQIGPYEVIEKLGEGGTGVVWKVRDPRSSRIYALKMMTKQLSLRRFKRELRAMVRLKHPNIVGVFDHGVLGENPYFTMEYIEGWDLKDYIRTQMPARNGQRWRPEDEAGFRRVCELVSDIARPLGFVHQQKVIHRDIKPANVMISREGQVKLMDFGLVKELDVQFDITLTKTGVFVGTVAYMSPEQGMGRAIDRRSDLYSLGVILYEMLTGQLPFGGANLVAVILKHIKEPPRPPTAVNPAVPRSLEAVTLKLLAKQPGDRYDSAEAVLEALRLYMAAPAGAGTEIAPEAILAPPVLSDYVLTRDRLYPPAFVGREREMALLRAQIDGALAGRGGLVLVAGEPGIGKTRLIDELADYARIKRARLFHGSCHEIERFPFQAFLGALEQIADRVAAMPSEQALDVLGPRGRVMERICPRFAELPLMARLPEVVDLEPMQDKLRSIDTVRLLLQRMSEGHPTLLVLDDLQWADEVSLELLAYLTRNLIYPAPTTPGGEAQGAPLLILGAYREDEVKSGHPLQRLMSELARQNLFLKIALRRFSRPQFIQMIESMTGVTDWPEPFADLLYREAGGNPLFTEEILRAHVEDGVIRRESGEWVFDEEQIGRASLEVTRGMLDSKLIRVPPAIREIVVRRLDRLSPEARSSLSRAAVIGRDFEYEVLARIVDLDEDGLLDSIDELLRNDLIVEAEAKGGQEVYAFQHDMLRHILYDEVSQSRLRRIHRTIGEAVEEIHARSPGEYIEALAHHFYNGAVWNKAFRYLHMAGDKARQGYVSQVALNYYWLALQVQEHLGEETDAARGRFSILGSRARVLALQGDYVKSREDCREMLALAERLDDRMLLGEACRNLGGAHLHLGEMEAARAAFQRALEIATAAGDRTGEVEAIDFMGSIHRMQGEFDQALAAYQRSLAISRELGKLTGEARSLINMGVVLYSQNKYEEALAAYERSLELYRRDKDKPQTAKCLNNIGGILFSRGDFDGAVHYYSESLAISKELGDRFGVAAISNNLGLVYFERGEHASAASCFLEALAIGRETSDKTGVAIALINLAMNRAYEGAGTATEPIYNESLALARETRDRFLEANCLFWIGDLHHQLGSTETARKFYEEACQLARSINLVLVEVLACSGLGRLTAEYGAIDEGLRLVVDSIEKAAAIGDVDGLLRAQLAELRILLMQGAFVEAQVRTSRLLRTVRDKGLHLYHWQIQHQHGRALRARGRAEPSHRALKSATDAVLAIADDCEDEFRERFLLQSDVQALFAELEALCRQLGRDGEAADMRKFLRR